LKGVEEHFLMVPLLALVLLIPQFLRAKMHFLNFSFKTSVLWDWTTDLRMS
jgi:hypothetical protein